MTKKLPPTKPFCCKNLAKEYKFLRKHIIEELLASKDHWRITRYGDILYRVENEDPSKEPYRTPLTWREDAINAYCLTLRHRKTERMYIWCRGFKGYKPDDRIKND